MQGRKLLLVFLVAIAAGVVGTGCGGDDEDPVLPPVELGPTGPTGPSESMSRREFIAEADDVCAEAYTALQNLPAQAATLQRASIVEGMVNSLDSLGRAPADQGGYRDFIQALDDAANAYDNDDTLTGDAALSEARQAATEYGFKDCGEEGQELGGASAGQPTEPTPTEPTTPAPTTPTTPPSGGTDTTEEEAPDGDDTGGGGTGGVSP